MKALIIAAGNGTRMQPVTKGRHKSLMPLLGLKIIDRVILGAKEAGITDFVIVTGYRSDEVKKTVGSGKKYGVRIRYKENKDWEKANGLSVYKAKNLLNENFMLLMSDHIFDPSILKELLQQSVCDKQSILAIDRKLDSVRDVSDTTKVVLQNSTVKAIGKDLQIYDAYDTGIFLCTPYVFEALRKSTAKGKNSLSDGMRMLARENKLKVFDVTGRLWSDCDTYEDIKFAEKKLFKSAKEKNSAMIIPLPYRGYVNV